MKDEKILATGLEGGFLGKYVWHELQSRLAAPLEQVLTVGRSPYNDVACDLTAAVPALPEGEAFDTVIHLCGSCDDRAPEDAVAALNVTATANLLKVLGTLPAPRRFVYVSSTEVYGYDEGTGLAEDLALRPANAVGRTKAEAEKIIAEWCAARGVECLILRAPAIVGTGMKGRLRRMVNSIYRATYHHIADETARLSVVHATDVARAVCSPDIPAGVYNITDGADPSRRALADALAGRMGKKVMTLKPSRAGKLSRLARWLPWVSFDNKRLAARYRTLTFSSERLQAAGFHPTPVVDYLNTHVYDEHSL